MLQRALDDAIVPERQPHKKGSAKRSASLPPAPSDPAGKAAHAALEGQCLYVSTVSRWAGRWAGGRAGGQVPGRLLLAGCRSWLCWQWQQCSLAGTQPFTPLLTFF
jgi:hypothetical protein